MNSSDRRPIALVGLMGAGKSAVARLLGQRLGARVIDLDLELEAEEGASISEIFTTRGEPEFRRREAALLARAIESGAGVLACGGGVVLGAGSTAQLRDRCRTVWLEVTPSCAAIRAGRDGAIRPLLEGGPAQARLQALLAERAPLYRGVASHRVATDDRTVEQVADAVIEALAAEPRS